MLVSLKGLNRTITSQNSTTYTNTFTIAKVALLHVLAFNYRYLTHHRNHLLLILLFLLWFYRGCDDLFSRNRKNFSFLRLSFGAEKVRILLTFFFKLIWVLINGAYAKFVHIFNYLEHAEPLFLLTLRKSA